MVPVSIRKCSGLSTINKDRFCPKAAYAHCSRGNSNRIRGRKLQKLLGGGIWLGPERNSESSGKASVTDVDIFAFAAIEIQTGISFAKGKPVLDIFCRDADNDRHVIQVYNLPCYFYVRDSEIIDQEDVKKYGIGESYGYISLYGESLKKITVHKISDIRKLGKIYHGFESDLKWDKKCLLDLQITDKFAHYENGVYTLDERFNALKPIDNVIDTSDGFSSSSIFKSDAAALIVKKALEQEKELSDHIPIIGHTPFEVRYAVIDIEVIVDKREKLKTYDGNIVCAVIWDSYTGEYYKFKIESPIRPGSEQLLVRQILEKLKELDVDIITGWNVEFDIKWILNKALDYSIELESYFIGGKTFITKYTDASGEFHEDIYLGGRVLVDSMALYMKKTMTTEKLNSYSLKSVAGVEQLDEWEDLGPRVKELWDKEPDRVVEYCRLDVERTMQIIERKRLIAGALTTCKFFGCGFDEVTVNSKVIESMAFMLKRNRVMPNIVRGRDKANVKGAVVLETIVGLHRNVGIFDAASLYPSIIAGLNISPECLVPGKDLYKDNTSSCIAVEVEGIKHFLLHKNKRIGLMTEVITEMRKLREQIREARQKATDDNDQDSLALYTDEEKVAKGVLASVYGVMGFKDFRLFNEDCANIITSVARGMIEKIKVTLETDEFKVIYGDTDSVFIQCKNIEAGFKAQKIINDFMPEYLRTFGVEENVIEVNFEKFFKWIMFMKKVVAKRKNKMWKKTSAAAKKNYIGFISHKESGPGVMKEVSELYFRGVALRRSDSAKVLKDVMRKFFNLMEDGDFHKSIAYLREVKKAFHTYEMDYVCMPRSINNEEAKGPWPDGLRYSKEVLKLEFSDDEMPKLIYVKDQRVYPQTKVLCYQEGHVIPPEFKIDYDIMFDKIIRAKFEPILESLGLYWDTYINDQQTLEKWV